MRRPLKTTTALVTSFALAVPVTFPAMAQEGRSRADIRAEVCTDAMTVDECNVAISEARAAERGQNGQQSENGGIPAEVQGEAAGQAETQSGAEPAPQPELQPGAEPAPQAEVQEGAAPEVQPESQEPVAQPEEPSTLDRVMNALTGNGDDTNAPAGSEEAPAEAPVETPVDPQVQAPVETPVDPQVAPEAQAESQAESGTQAETQAEVPTEAPSEEPSTLDRVMNALTGNGDDTNMPAGSEEAPAEAEVQAQTGEQTGAEADVTTEAEAPAEEPSTLDRVMNALTGNGDETNMPAGSVDGTTAEAEQPVPTEPSEAATEAASGEAEAPLAATESGEVVDESTETVTEESARLSSEDYERAQTEAQAGVDATGQPAGQTEAQAQAQAQGQQQAQNEDDNLNRFLQGALVGAAGALVVGALLNGNREVVGTAPDRVVVRDRNGHLQVLRDDDAILRQPGSEVTTRRYSDGSSETIVMQRDGSQVVTVRNAEARVVKRVVIHADGSRTILFDDTQTYEPVVISQLPEPNRQAAPQVNGSDEQALRVALQTSTGVDRAFSLNQIRQIDRVRYLAPAAQVENITFDTGSAAISPDEAQNLLALGNLMTSMIADNPNEVFLIEGHTDAVGSDVMNLTLSDRRAESVARALTEYFGVSPANMVLQGYGESDLRIATASAERENRRVVVRRITPLLQVASN